MFPSRRGLPVAMKPPSIAIVGAGLAGLACARRLRAAGLPVRVFDKGRAPGGRMSTRRGELAEFDHGAQYFTLREPAFMESVEAAAGLGQVARWTPRWPGGEQESRDLWVGVPGMAALPAMLAEGLDIALATPVAALARKAGGWRLMGSERQELGAATLVVLAMPAPQAALLAAPWSPLARRAEAVAMAPCWAAMVAFEQPLEVSFDADWSDDSVLPWLARNASKPGRAGPDAWVLHAAPGWSRERLESPALEVQVALVERFERRAGRPLPAIVAASVHRWRYARAEAPLGEPFLADWDTGLACCGDWCLDARIEAAFMSGDRLGEELVTRYGG
jgi:renalase